MADRFKRDVVHLDSPLEDGESIPDGADTVLVNVSRAIYVGGGGDFIVRMAKSQTNLPLVGIPAGTMLPLRVDAIYLNGHTATKVVSFH